MTIEITDMDKEDLQRLIIQEELDRSEFALSRENLDSLRKYVFDKIPPGGFLRSVLENNLKEACGRADMRNRRKLFEYVEWLYNKAPASCWGSPENVTQWLAIRENVLAEQQEKLLAKGEVMKAEIMAARALIDAIKADSMIGVDVFTSCYEAARAATEAKGE